MSITARRSPSQMKKFTRYHPSVAHRVGPHYMANPLTAISEIISARRATVEISLKPSVVCPLLPYSPHKCFSLRPKGSHHLLFITKRDGLPLILVGYQAVQEIAPSQNPSQRAAPGGNRTIRISTIVFSAMNEPFPPEE